MLHTYSASFSEKIKLAENIYQFEFKLDNPQTIYFEAGQYILLDVNQGFRQYSISSSSLEKNLVQTIVDVSPMGLGSLYLLKLKPKDNVSFRAPMGVFTLKNNLKTKYFLATGAGISPIKSMIQFLVDTNFQSKFSLLWGLRDQVYLQDYFHKLASQNNNFNYFYCLSKQAPPNGQCFDGRIQKKLETIKTKLNRSEFYLCGKSTTILSLKDYLETEIKIKPEDIHYEQFN